MNVESVPAIELNGVIADFADEILRDRAGGTVALRPQAFAVLRRLAASPNRLVTKDELMAAVWPGIAVTDDSLVQAVRDIRLALGDERQEILKPVPRRGYRLVPPAPAAPLATPRPARRRFLPAGAALVLAGAALAWWLAGREAPVLASVDGPPTVAVVPFVDVAGDAASRQLAGVFALSCQSQLLRFHEFRVVGRSSTFVYRDQPAGGLEIGYLLGGTIQRDGDRLQLTVALSDPATGGALWSERFDRPDRDVPGNWDGVAEQIANRLGGRGGVISQAGRTVAASKRPGDRTAWELFLLGSGELAQGTRTSTIDAVTLLGRALALDPSLAHASAELALARITLAEFGIDPESNRREAVAAAEEAVFLDPADAWAHAALGAGFRLEGENMRARSEFETALEIAPGVSEILALYAGWAASAGEPERGAAIADRVTRLEPEVSPWTAAQFAGPYFMAGRYRTALDMIDRLPADALTPALRVMQASALAAVGRRDQAAATVAAAVAAVPGLSIETIASAPRFGAAERRRLIDTMRLAGFPPCAAPQALQRMSASVRLPECAALSAAAGR
jgi:TolB-like protein/DNA-binding winged helix-turn-helix (wHTH) protein